MMTTVSADQDALRVANRYASMIEKAATLQARARACQDAADQYRRDARSNQESAENHRVAARTSRDVSLAHGHAMAARDAETEAAREILAARLYEEQATTYWAQARAETGQAATSSYANTTGKEAMTTNRGATGPAAADTTGLPDAAGLAATGGEHWHGSDVLTPKSGDGTVSLGLCRYPDSDAYVVLATNPPGKTWAPDTDDGIDPALSRKEAGQVARALDDLVAHAQSGAPLRVPTKVEKLAARIRLLGDSGVTIAGEEGEIEVSAADLRKLLDAAVPEPAVPARRKINAKACEADDMDTGAVWVELDTSSGEPMVAIASTEGEPPESYPAGYTVTRLSLAEAADLAAKVRRFATATAEDATAEGGTGTPTPEASLEQRILAAYEQLATRPGCTIRLVDLQREVGSTKEDLEQALIRLDRDRQIHLEPDPHRAALTPEDRAAAVPLAGQDMHLMYRVLPAEDLPGLDDGKDQPTTGSSEPAQARRVTNPRGTTYEYDPADGSTAVIEPETLSSRLGPADRQAAVHAPVGSDDDATQASDGGQPAAGYAVSPKQLMALHGLYKGLVKRSNGAPTVYGVNVRRQLDALADKGIISRTGQDAYIIPFGSPGEQIIAADPDFSVGAHLHTSRGAKPASAPAPGQARRVANPRGRVYEYDPTDDSTAVIEPDGWRAVVPPSSPTGAIARLLWWNAEIKDGRGDDATEETARALLTGLTGAELREVADEVGMSARTGRTKPQLVDAIVALTITSARKSRALFRG